MNQPTLQALLKPLSADAAAQRLLGCELERTIDGQTLRVRIVETEAYDQTDAASHSYNGRTARTDVMFGPAGRCYIYFTYGMHYCCNVVVGNEGYGAGALIRAVEPIRGVSAMTTHRRGKVGIEISNGPAKLCQALSVDKRLSGHDLENVPFRLIMRPELQATDISVTPRIGISKAKDTLWRFYITGNPYVSKPH